LGKAVRNDEELFEKIKAGHGLLGEIVDEIARKYADDLLEFCGRILVTYQRQRLDDIVQEVFEAVYRNIQRYDIDRGHEGIKSWLYGIARNKCVDKLREMENRETELEPSYIGGEEKEERPPQIILAKRAFAELPTNERLMVATRLMGWFSRKEMAEMCGYDNPESYDRQFSRILQKMRKIIDG
jgi:RNA polymerase sigma factor (sigma-70 family)